jgi:3-hydroxyacyl-CoA dehydrogenase
MVRLHLQYVVSIWDPDQKDLTKVLDKIQREAARFVKETAMAEQKVFRNLQRN